MSFAGEKDLSIAANGDLVLQGEHGSAAFHKPVVYQEENGQREAIPGGFRLIAKNAIAFTIGSYDHSRPLIIDPVLVYSTYLGGTGTIHFGYYYGDRGNGVAVDTNGSAYVVGSTSSIDFPVTTGTIQKKNKTASTEFGTTVFVTKFNAAGTALEYSTYLGGTGSGDVGNAIAVDSANSAYITGTTYSADFPVTSGAYQKVNNAVANLSTNVFVARLNSAGNALVYSTFLGGSSSTGEQQGDAGQAIAVDSAGNAYVTGSAISSDFPVTAGAIQPHRATPNAPRPASRKRFCNRVESRRLVAGVFHIPRRKRLWVSRRSRQRHRRQQFWRRLCHRQHLFHRLPNLPWGFSATPPWSL